MNLSEIQLSRPAIAGATSDKELDLFDDKTLSALDLIELRIDFFHDISEGHVTEVFKKARKFDKPLIATVRSIDEGGKQYIHDPERLRLIRLVSRHADLIDIEAGAKIFNDARSIIKNEGKTLIASYHNFEKTPDYKVLSLYVEELKRKGADIVKIATKASNRDDLKVMTSLTLNFADEGIVTICMGRTGLVTRVFFPLIGSLFSFASIGSSKASGQISVIELREYMDLLS